jgi:hypothetical protein
VSGFLREVGHRPERPARDPMGKAALFSEPAQPEATGEPTASEASAAAARSTDGRRPATVVIECSACGESTRVSYVEFALGNLPFSMWLPPLPALYFNRHMTCPACAQFAWVRAHWLA